MLSNSLWGELEIIKGLTFRSQLGYDYANSQYQYFQPGSVTYNTGYVTVGSSNMSNGTDMTFQNTLVYDKKFGEHSINILAGQSTEDHRGYSINAVASGFPNEVIGTLNVATTPTTASASMSRNTAMSWFGRAQYSFLDRYLLNASIRYDGSSRFGSNSKWGLFPSVSAAWKVNEESFLKNVTWISLLKLRGAWGTAGNNRIGNYDYLALLGKDNYTYSNAVVTGMAPSNIANDNLQWESTATTDIGLDFSVFKNRLQVNFDYYTNTTSNLLYNVPIPNSSGFSSFRTNLGSVRNNGWEIDFTSHNTVGSVKWTTQINLSRERNEVLDMGTTTQFIQTNWDAQFITKVGGPVSQFYVYETDGLLTPDDFITDVSGPQPKFTAKVPIFAGQIPGNLKYKDQNADGVINSSDLVAYGTNLPDFLYGITNTVTWKNFELSALLQGVVGGKICFLGQRHIDAGLGGNNCYPRWLHQWKPDYEALYGAGNDPLPRDMGIDWSWDGYTPSQVGVRGNNNDDTRIYDGTYLRVKNVTLSYNMPQSILSHISMKAARIYVSVDNWYTWTNYVSYDPETNSIGNSTTQLGVDYQTYPLSRRLIFGINVTF
jgi:TonB-linked SusC/RagA family outer membrane protein